MTTYYIYTLWLRDENDVFYVGISISPESRFKQHSINAKTFNAKIGYSIIDVIQCDPLSRLHLKMEQYWISQLTAWGFKLTNVPDHMRTKPSTRRKTENSDLPSFYFRKVITKQFHLRQIAILADQWGLDRHDAVSRLITDQIMIEKHKREAIP